MKSVCLTLLTVLCLQYTPTTLAWGWEAHKLICAMAEAQLTPQAAAMVGQLMNEGAELKKGGRNFGESCLWPDDAKYGSRKSTYEHHFINVPSDANSIDLSRDCAAINCTAVGIQQALTYLHREPDGDRALVRRAAALRFLGHYIGDLHQPLHVGNAADWGGNKIQVRFGGDETNLHAMWDYKMPERMGLTYPKSVPFLLTIKPPLPADNADILDWFNESLALARTHAYVDSSGRLIQTGETLEKAYFERAKPVILERIVQAAARLAHLLNRLAAGEKIQVFTLTPSSPD